MTSFASESLEISIGDGGNPTEVFYPLGSLKRARIVSTREQRGADGPASGAWQTRQPSGGLQDVRLQADGVFTDGEADAILRERLFDGERFNIEILFAEGGSLAGAFMLASYEWNLNIVGELRFNLSVVAAGNIIYTPPA